MFVFWDLLKIRLVESFTRVCEVMFAIALFNLFFGK